MTLIFVPVLSALLLKEKPTLTQLLGVVIVVCGVILFFSTPPLALTGAIPAILAALSGIGWASYMVVSRHCLRSSGVGVFTLTSYLTSLGSLLLLGAAILSRSIVVPTLDGWLIIVRLSVVNTALAFILRNTH